MQLDALRNAVGPANFDYSLDQFLRNGYTLARAVRTIARETGLTLQKHRTRSRFEKNLGADPFAKRQKKDPVIKKLTFESEPTAIMSGEDVNFRRSKYTLGRSKNRSANQLFKAQLGGMQESIFRWQSASKSLLGPGRIPIGYGQNSVVSTSAQAVPVHMMSLTTHPGFPETPTLGCRLQGLFRFAYFNSVPPTGGHFGYQFMPSQTREGLNLGTSQWVSESGPLTPSTQISQVFHKWTDIRLNLYGSSSFPLSYRVQIVTGLPTEMQPLEFESIIASPTAATDFPIAINNPLNQMLLDLARPVIGNPITGSNTDKDYKGEFRIVSDKTFNIPCLSYGNAAAEDSILNVNSTNVRNVNMFIRHDRFRDYAWRQKTTDINQTVDIGGVGWNQTDISADTAASMYCDVDREERLFIIISCNAAELINDAVDYNLYDSVAGAPPEGLRQSYRTSGSYDIVVRNCFRDGTQN